MEIPSRPYNLTVCCASLRENIIVIICVVMGKTEPEFLDGVHIEVFHTLVPV